MSDVDAPAPNKLFRLLAAVIAIAGALVLTTARPAVAHAELDGSDPGPGAQLEVAPTQVTLRFTEGVDVRSDGVQVLDGAGKPVEGVGRSDHPEGDRSTVVVPLPPLPDGIYVVSWRVTSADSHPISGAFTFGVGEAGGDQAAALAAAKDARPDGSRTTGIVFGVARFLVYAGLIILVGGTAFVVVLAPALADDGLTRRILWAALVVVAAMTVAGIGLQAAYTAGGALADAFDGELIGDVLGTRFGRMWLLRLGLCVLAAPLLARLPELVTMRSRQAVAGLLGVALLATSALSGHASAGDLSGLAIITDVAHMAGGAWWLGGLALLSVVVLRRLEPPGATQIAGRFSDMAPVAVAVVVVTGAFQSWRQVRSLDGLDTDFARLLLAKIAAVGALLLMAAAARATLVRRVPADGPGAAASDRPLSQLRRLVAAEAAIGALVIAITAALVNVPPAYSTAESADAAGAFAQEVHTASLAVQVTLDPSTVGPNDLGIVIEDHFGGVVDPPEVTAELLNLDNPVGTIDVPLTRTAPGVFTAAGVSLPFAGTWQLDVAVRTTEIDIENVTLEIPVA